MLLQNPTPLVGSLNTLLFMMIVMTLSPSDADARRRVLVVGTHEAPPFVMQNQDGGFSGISIELWEKIAAQLGLEYKLEPMEVGQLIRGLQNGSLDLAVGALTITSERIKKIDFSHPFFTSGLGIALVPNRSDKLEAVFKAVFSTRFFQALTGLVAVLLLIGLCIWLLERKANPEQFGGKFHRGWGGGFWWAAVTMTTVGFGDKAPVTFLGRLLAIVWMFASVITISGFTAAIASVFTLQEIEGRVRGPQDLYGISVGIVKDTTSAAYAESHRLRSVAYKNVSAALQALSDDKVGAVVYDAPILQYLTASGDTSHIRVLPNTFLRQDYAFGLPEKSPLRENINAVLLEQIASDDWKTLLSNYMGEQILEKF
ncbi:MAG: transporter substrate-binding domain-containing protein [Gammaproteobacteria bacterium]